MTSWKYVMQLFLFVFLIMIDLSKEDCYDYFDVKKWAGNLSEIVTLVKAKDFKDTMECTLEKKCKRDDRKGIACYLLHDCFEMHRDFQNKTQAGNCTGETQNISFYNFMCMTAKAINLTVKGCELDTVCNVYAYTEMTTVLPPTRAVTAATTTTATATTTTTAATTTTATATTTTAATATTTTTTATTTTTTTAAATVTTVLPPTTTATIATLAPPASTLAPTSTVSTDSPKSDTVCNVYAYTVDKPPHTEPDSDKDNKVDKPPHTEPDSDKDNKANNLILLLLLMMSLICNMVVPLVVYQCMRRQSRRDRNQWVENSTHGSNENLPEDEEFKSLFVTQPPECHSVLTHSTGNSTAAEEKTQL